MGRFHRELRRSPKIPIGYVKCGLRKEEFLLVTLRIFGTLQSNYRTGGRAILMHRFKLDAKLSNELQKGYQDLSKVLPKMVEIVSLNSEVCTDLAAHLWHVGIDVDPRQIKNNFDVTGRKKSGEIERTYQWYIKGPISNE